MARLTPDDLGGGQKGRNLVAALDTVAISELGREILAKSDNGYNVIVGSTPDNITFFRDYSRHPRKLVYIDRLHSNSTAAGRYQILARYADFYTQSLKLPDFGPKSQDRIALQLMSECNAVLDFQQGRFALAIEKCRSRWASLPGAGYPGQRENSIAYLTAAYTGAGGAVA